MRISRKPPKDRDYYYAPNTPYPKDTWVHIPYVRYSRRDRLLQNLAMGSAAILLLALVTATYTLNSLGIDPTASPLPESTLRILTALCGFLSPAAMALFVWLDHHATIHTWWCIFSRAEVKFYLTKGERLYRTRHEQETQQAGLIIRYVLGGICVALAVVIAILNLTGQSLNLTDF